jgi:hypothetical protein
MLVYRSNDRAGYDVGYYNPTGEWCPLGRSFDTSDAAEQHLHYLNGGVQTPLAAFDALARRIARGFAVLEASLEGVDDPFQRDLLLQAVQATANGLFAVGDDQEGKRRWFMGEALPIWAETADA